MNLMRSDSKFLASLASSARNPVVNFIARKVAKNAENFVFIITTLAHQSLISDPLTSASRPSHSLSNENNYAPINS